jgi:YHS domain-containing protein
MAPGAAASPGLTHHRPVPPGPVVKPGEAKLGDTSTCPVSGETFVVAADSPSVQYGGKTYYFCCEDCIDDFQKDPARYVGSRP